MDIKRVCVVGGGISGLTTIKHLLEYGLVPVCYEKSQYAGGLWRYNEGDRTGVGSVMRNTMLNTSKEFVALSDFPIGEKEANFARNDRVWKYFMDYAEHFGLLKHIEFGSDVKKVERHSTYETTGKWTVTVVRDGKEIVEVFDAVAVCNGHHVRASQPDIPGLANFKGNVVHSHDYKDHRQFHDQRVLVVGFGNSGGDVACELARVAKQVTVSTRNGSWVTRRVVDQGYPRDVILRSRHFEKANSMLPARVRQWLALYEYNNFFDHELYGLRPRELPGQSPVLLADDLPLLLSGGFIQIKGGISTIQGNTVQFETGERKEFDSIIICTGYDFCFDFIEDGRLIPTKDNQVSLWKRIYAPNEKHHSLAIVGLVDPLGSTITMVEMQARAVVHVWANPTKLPAEDQMKSDIEKQQKATAARFICSLRKSSLQIDYISYMDELARLIGCFPPLSWELVQKDPKLAFMLYFGPTTASHYRLTGPHKDPKARQQIIDLFRRVHLAMNPDANESRPAPYALLILNRPVIIMLTAIAVLVMILIGIIF